jgi:hypothetical protein
MRREAARVPSAGKTPRLIRANPVAAGIKMRIKGYGSVPMVSQSAGSMGGQSELTLTDSQTSSFSSGDDEAVDMAVQQQAEPAHACKLAINPVVSFWLRI